MLALRQIPQSALQFCKITFQHSYKFAKDVLQNKIINDAAAKATLIAVIAFKEKISSWFGYSTKSQECLDVFKTLKDGFSISDKNTTILVAKIQKKVSQCFECELNSRNLSNLYFNARKKSENLLQSINTNNEVKRSMIESGLVVLPDFENEHTSGLELYTWIEGNEICHREKVFIKSEYKKCELREESKKGELSSCKLKNEKLTEKSEKLRDQNDKKFEKLRKEFEQKMQELRSEKDQEIKELQETNTECQVNKKACEVKLDKCENKGSSWFWRK